jgi:hypothetical protein
MPAEKTTDRDREKTRVMRTVRLWSDRGGEIVFNGYPYAKTSFYDDRSGLLTRQELYALEDGRQAFSIVSIDGESKSRRAYVVEREGEICHIDDGKEKISMPLDSIMDFARMLLEIDASRTKRQAAFNAKTANE